MVLARAHDDAFDGKLDGKLSIDKHTRHGRTWEECHLRWCCGGNALAKHFLSILHIVTHHNYTSHKTDHVQSYICGMFFFSFSHQSRSSPTWPTLKRMHISTPWNMYHNINLFNAEDGKKCQFVYWSINKLCLTALHNSPKLSSTHQNIIIVFHFFFASVGSRLCGFMDERHNCICKTAFLRLVEKWNLNGFVVRSFESFFLGRDRRQAWSA